MTPTITVTHGRRTTTFAVDGVALRPTRVYEDFGQQGGVTEYLPPDEWVSPAARREAEDRLAAVDEPRRKRR